MSPRALALLGHLALSLSLIAATTAICSRVVPVNAITTGFAYLVVVLVIAAAWGRIEAVLSAVAATLCFNFFFLPPVGKFTIADSQNWIALLAFLSTALIASHLSDRARTQALQSKSRQQETEQLYALSRAILLTDPGRPLGFQTAQSIAEIFDCPAVALYDAKSRELFRGGVEELPEVESKLKQVLSQGDTVVDGPERLVISAIILGGHPVGSVALKGLSLSDGAFQALLNLVAIAIERVRAQEAANRAEAARQGEEFKSTLLDAIAHEFKTPLTSIKAASTSMLSGLDALSPQFREYSLIIDEEADRLNSLVTEVVRMSQIDTGKMRLKRAPVVVADLINNVITDLSARADGRTMNLHIQDVLPNVSADPELVALAVKQLIDNALKYSPPAAPVDVTAERKGQFVTIHVVDQGPGLPERDRERVFERFYRSPSVRSLIPGTGMGLFIAREIIRLHGGEVWIEDGAVSSFCLSLPLDPEGVPQ